MSPVQFSEMPVPGTDKSISQGDLLARAGQQSAQLAAQLRADAATLNLPEHAGAANALKQCADTAERVAKLLIAGQENTA
jgi:hypothetical protein